MRLASRRPRLTVSRMVPHKRQKMAASMTPVSGPLRTAFRLTRLQFASRSRQDFEGELNSKVPAQVRRAGIMLKALDAGKRVEQLDYPLQAVRFGNTLTLVALGGEVTVDYGLRIRREYSGEPLITSISMRSSVSTSAAICSARVVSMSKT